MYLSRSDCILLGLRPQKIHFLMTQLNSFNRCDQSCPKGCDGRDSECDQQFRCVIGCKFNYWGPTCQPCSEECTNSTSPETVARCLESDGFCQFGCSVGKYGHTCSETCPRHCKDVICTQTSGECHTCTKGYFGNYCNSTCSSNCPDNDCYPDNGTCVADTCLLTQHAWYGPSCDLRCPETCKNRVCDKYSWYCLDGCVTGYFGNSCNLGMVVFGLCNKPLLF